MPNHVPLILTPGERDGPRRALSRVHRRYAGAIHGRQRRRGHFWQGRFGAVAMDEAHLAAALRSVLLNPVRARLVRRAEDWPWSSLQAQLSGIDDGVTTPAPARERFPDLRGLLADYGGDGEAHRRLRRAESVGRPLGGPAFLARVEALLGRPVAAQKRGPKPKRPQE